MPATLVYGPDHALASGMNFLRNALRRTLFGIRKSDAPTVEDELLRLAETSGHLLRDVGLAPEGGPKSEVWSDGRHRIAVPQPSTSDVALRAGRV